MADEPSQFDRKRSHIALREAMGGEPAFFGPLQRAVFGYKLFGKTPGEVQSDMAAGMREADEISRKVPRRAE